MDYGDYNKEHSEKHKEITQIPKKNSILYFTYLCALQLRNVEQILINNVL